MLNNLVIVVFDEIEMRSDKIATQKSNEYIDRNKRFMNLF
jgi:hypothetical protein